MAPCLAKTKPGAGRLSRGEAVQRRETQGAQTRRTGETGGFDGPMSPGAGLFQHPLTNIWYQPVVFLPVDCHGKTFPRWLTASIVMGRSSHDG